MQSEEKEETKEKTEKEIQEELISQMRLINNAMIHAHLSSFLGIIIQRLDKCTTLDEIAGQLKAAKDILNDEEKENL